MSALEFGKHAVCQGCGNAFNRTFASQSKCPDCLFYKNRPAYDRQRGYEPMVTNTRPMPARPTAPRPAAPRSEVRTTAPRPAVSGSDFWKRPEAQPLMFAPFLTTPDKRELAESGDTFRILAVRYKPVANYGPEWNLDIEWTGKFNAAGTNVFTLSLQSNVQRDAMFTGLMDFLKENPDASVPAILTAVAKEDGNWFYSIGNPEAPEPQAAPADRYDVPF